MEEDNTTTQRFANFMRENYNVTNEIPSEFNDIFRQAYHDFIIADHHAMYGEPQLDNFMDYIRDENGYLIGEAVPSNDPNFNRFMDYIDSHIYEARTDVKPNQANYDNGINPNQIGVPLAKLIQPVQSEVMDNQSIINMNGYFTSAERATANRLDRAVNPPPRRRSIIRQNTNNILRNNVFSNREDLLFY